MSSATDLVRWYHALASGRILSRRMIKIALTPVTLMDGSKAPYGLGWYITINDRQTIAHHGGSSFGFRSYVYWSPRRDLVALTLLNSSGPDEPKEQTLKLFWRFYPSKGRSKSSVLSAGRNWR